MKIALQHACERHVENARGETGEQSEGIDENIGSEITHEIDVDRCGGPHKFLVSKQGAKHLLHVPG